MEAWRGKAGHGARMEGELGEEGERIVERKTTLRFGSGGVARVAAAWGRRHREDGSAVRRGSGGDGGGNDNNYVLVAGARSGNGRGDTEACGGGENGWTPSPAFREQQLEREETPFFFQMMARVRGGGSLPLLYSPKWAERGKGPLEAHDPKPKHTHRNKKVHEEEGLCE